ncbi:GMC family oxidoreductase (plasmid) [Bradyrhizobium quebecense]|uniref:GMC family oxidoreductase n=1 Tax=Bradyrhizobium quebecense TaxID=2748629 RepID=A0A973WZG6_9BRAD|nr:GMC family oxidoreductase [Bradyrhizobium quebecense]UGA48907.1 GMC family oxidoreductase [Bradyrhizobium quebecense]
MADNCIECDVVIVGSGFAGSLIAKELSQKPIDTPNGKRRLNVVILEAGPGVQPNINGFMRNFYKASLKIPESPYPPSLSLAPAGVAAGRPSFSGATWKDPEKAYFDQKDSTLPFKSTYERLAGGTSHWMGLTPRLVPNDFRMNEQYKLPFPDWPISYETLMPWYEKAEAELGVSGDVADHSYAGVTYSPGYAFPMPKIPPSLFDQHVNETLANFTDDETAACDFLGTAAPVTSLTARSQPAARNSLPYRNRRACAGNTSCIPICPIQAKYDPTITLNEATNSGAKLMDHTVASEILVDANDRVSAINFITYKDEAGPRTGTGCIKAKVYIIAANGIETPRLLLMSTNGGRTPAGVANKKSGLVGKNLMDHPQFLSWGLLPVQVFPYRGPLVTSAIGDLCDGPFRTQRAAFRISLGNEAWTATVGGSGGDPHVTTLDFINGVNLSGVNNKGSNKLADNVALLGDQLRDTLGNLISRQFRIAFAVEQSPDENNRVTLSSATDALGLPRPKIKYDVSDYTKQGIAAAFRLKNVIFKKLGAEDFTHTAESDPGGFDQMVDGKTVRLTYGGAGHVMGTYRMGNDPNTSVVDSFQRSHDHANLYLVGSGTFPTVGTANPTITLSALALRTADSIGRNFKDI